MLQLYEALVSRTDIKKCDQFFLFFFFYYFIDNPAKNINKLQLFKAQKRWRKKHSFSYVILFLVTPSEKLICIRQTVLLYSE